MGGGIVLQPPGVDTLAQLVAGEGTTVDATAPYLKVNVNGLRIVRMATAVALPACTYYNGAGGDGVGATLTGDAVGALANIDGVTPVANDRILVKNQAASLQNGIYDLTVLGGGGAFVLTRSPVADTAAEHALGIFALVLEGQAFGGSIQVPSPKTVTMGTTGIMWRGANRPNATPADAMFGPNRNRRRYSTDFEELDVALVVTGGATQRIPGTPFSVQMIGTLTTATQIGLTDLVPGAVDLATGTDTTGYCEVFAGSQWAAFDSTKRFRYYTRVKTPTISSAAELFIVRAGAHNAISGASPTAGIYFEAPSDGTNWLAVCRNASVQTAVDTGQAQATSYKPLYIDYDEATATATFYMGISGVMTLVATITTNLPTVVVRPSVQIDKQGGTGGITSRSVRVDMLTADGYDSRTLKELAP